jgi:hypothetical protein
MVSALATIGLSMAAGCGAKTELRVGPSATPDASVVDAGEGLDAHLTDAHTLDAAHIDASGDAGFADGCMRDRDCERGLACTAATAETSYGRDLEPMPLGCGPLARLDDRAVCETASDCGRGLCVIAGTCVPPCRDDSDCDAAAACRLVYGRTTEPALQPYSGCVRRYDVGETVRVETERLEGALTGTFREDEIRLADFPGTALHALEPESTLAYVLGLSTLGDSPEVLFELRIIGPRAPPPLNPVAPFGGVLTVLLPNGPRSVRAAEGYLARLTADRPSDLRLTTFWRTTIGTRLAVDFYYLGGGRLGPGGAIDAAVSEVNAIYARSGIRIDRVRHHLIGGELRRRYAVIEMSMGEAGELEELLALSAGAPGPSVDVFLVRELDTALGVAGGIPAPPMHGSPNSGLAIAADFLEPGGDLSLGRTMAHELGHVLGLFHTSEIDGIVLDPFPDTPECRLERDLDGDGFLIPPECEGAGADHLMFWAATGDRLSAAQGAVVVRSPMLD